ncbi:MAG: S9 family peptidase [Bacteroidetes bacterium]|nr:S9 family peptidase [Bacteroidota bacterium]
MKLPTFRSFVFLVSILWIPAVIAQDEKPVLTLDDIFKAPKFFPHMVYGLNSMNDGKSYCVIESDSLNVYDYKSGKFIKTLVTKNDLIPEGDSVPIRLESYTFSDDESRILIPTETEPIYRHSSESNYFVYDLKSKKLQSISQNGKQRLASFSPDGSQVAFVRENNLFIAKPFLGEETQITQDGKDRSIINGTTDWVYEEEFGFTKGYFWSPDGKQIAYYRFDETGVPEYQMQIWGNLYPENYQYKYPKAGEDNSLVTIHVYNILEGSTQIMDLGEETDQYIPRIKWTADEGILAIQRLNRLQNHLDILLADASTGKTKVIYTEDNPYYIDITDHWTFLPDQEHYIITSEKSGYNHIYLYDLNGQEIRQLTSGEWDVINVTGYDSRKKLVYYVSAESSPLNRDLYSVDMEGNKRLISSRTGTNDAEFSKTYEYYINTFSDANTPPYITVNKSDGKEIRVIENNEALLNRIHEYGFSQKEFFEITTSEGIRLNAWKILPWNFEIEKKYPVLMTVYGGPGSQTVTNSWGYGDTWYQYLAENGIMVVSVDNRGTGARGQEFKKMTYLQLGKFETLDQIEAARYIVSLDYVNPEHIGIFGWSYGGYMSTLCITKGSDVFSTAIAVAPVTNWRYYDNIYTERFMRTPQENPGGYDDNSPINHVDKMKGNYLLVHGTGDDNVHVQNTMDLITALVAANKQFELLLYPNKNHGIYGGNTRYHLYTRMTDFLIKSLK